MMKEVIECGEQERFDCLGLPSVGGARFWWRDGVESPKTSPAMLGCQLTMTQFDGLTNEICKKMGKLKIDQSKRK